MTASLPQVTGPWAPLDLAFERFLRTKDGGIVARTGRLLSRQRARGHSRLYLRDWAGKEEMPELSRWREALQASPLVSDGSTPAALVFDGEAVVCLYRYWRAEQRLAAHLRRLATAPTDDKLPDSFFTRFPAARAPEADWQAIASACALRHRISVITGGPGTGKTTVVAQILGLLLEREPGLRIKLAAPTGKAASRLAESLAARADLPSLPVQTLHALLGGRGGRFRYHAQNPLDVQALLVDETSMADLLLLLAVFDAVPENCRIILLGDSGQLASVETGCVLADISAAGRTSTEFTDYLKRHNIAYPADTANGLAARTTPNAEAAQATEAQGSLFAPPAPVALTGSGHAVGVLAGKVVELRKNWRFADRPGIGLLAAALRRGEVPQLPEGTTDVEILPPEENTIRAFLAPQWQTIHTADSPAAALQALLVRRVLCATRRGTWGVARVNLLMRQLTGVGRSVRYYAGQPVLIEENDYSLGLMNGDTGICLPDAEGRLVVWFPGGRQVAPEGLPAHSESWALTVHKSQGSEFDEVLLLLPEEGAKPLCRELAYTGATRARKKLLILAQPGAIAAAAAHPATRASGLRELLTED